MSRLIRRAIAAATFALISLTSHAAGWQYEESTNKMDATVLRFASVESNETVQMPFPYKAHKPRLTLRTKDGKALAVVLMFNGQANTSNVDGGNVRVKFDDGKPMSWAFGMPENAGKTGLIFLHNERGFVDRVLKSKTVTIELDYWSHGKEVVTFAVSGLDMKRLGAAK